MVSITLVFFLSFGAIWALCRRFRPGYWRSGLVLVLSIFSTLLAGFAVGAMLGFARPGGDAVAPGEYVAAALSQAGMFIFLSPLVLWWVRRAHAKEARIEQAQRSSTTFS